jgi:hypothetical protein
MTISMPSPRPVRSQTRSPARSTALPEPDAASSGGAWHRPRPSPLHLAIIAAAATLAIGLSTGCTDSGDGDGAFRDPSTFETPRSDVAAPLAGDWFVGSLSTIQYYDSYTGEFQDPAGEGFFFVFNPDGSYQTGAGITTIVGGCESRLLGDEQGTVTVDGSLLTMYRDHITVEYTSQCGDDGTNTEGAEVHQLSWNVYRDDYGVESLDLIHDDGSVETYHRWQ